MWHYIKNVKPPKGELILVGSKDFFDRIHFGRGVVKDNGLIYSQLGRQIIFPFAWKYANAIDKSHTDHYESTK